MAEFYAAHPLWTWMIVAGVLLAAEVATGSGWLLWPAASAALVGLLTPAGLPIGWEGELAVFSVLTIASSLLAHRFIPDFRLRSGPDINDRTGDLVGKTGMVTSAFSEGHGRVLVDGAEWQAEADDAPTGKVVVEQVLGGARLKVRGTSA
jgi:membrane protein implicated in regulation of membrane protease activity